MKQLIPVIFFTFVLTAFTVRSFDSRETIQIIATIPELNSKELQEDIIQDLKHLSGIQFIETSLISKTLVLNYNSNNMSLDDIDHVLKMWGCSLGESSYRTLSTSNYSLLTI